MKWNLVARLLGGLGIYLCITLPAWAVTVLNTNDSGPGSLRDAIASHASFIDFLPAVFSTPKTIFLGSRLPSIDSNLWIDGPGANLLTVDGQNLANNDALITIFDSFPVVRLEGFKLTGGNDPISTGNVGGIFTRSNQLTLENMVLANNQGTGVFIQGGGMSVINSTLSGNTRQAIFNQVGNLTISNSTLSGNTNEGLFNQVGVATIANSTLALNGTGGVINQGGDLTIRNSTVAGNVQFGVSSNISGGPTPHSLIVQSSIFGDNGLFDLSYDQITTVQNCLVEHGSSLTNGVDGNIVGFDPLLGPFALNGGPTATMLPLPGSRAINAGSNPLSLSADQRGFGRVFGGRIDIGAVETIPEPSSVLLVSISMFTALRLRRRRSI